MARLIYMTLVHALAVWGLASLAEASTWRDMPPPQYQGTVTVLVAYHDRQVIRNVCGRDKVACYSMNTIYLPRQCGEGVQRETINVRELMRDESYCASVKAHEAGHALGWNHG